jgi:hypothetical protein
MSTRPDPNYVNPNYNGPIQSNPGDGESAIVIYGYIPSAALAIVAIVTFGIALIGHFCRSIKPKETRAFHALFVTGCVSYDKPSFVVRSPEEKTLNFRLFSAS